MRNTSLAAAFCCCLIAGAAMAQNTKIDGSKVYQTINGLGVNANPQSWNKNPEAVKKVVDQLIDVMGCTSFRLMFDDCDWEKVNDNDDPETYNWQYYDSIYSAPRFTGIWEMIRYLNKKGITDITLSPDGATPTWMGGTHLLPGKEAEYAETMSSMLYYATKRLSPAVSISRISPINETTCEGNEGVATTPAQFDSLYQHVAQHLIRENITGVTIIGPDDCGGWMDNFKAMAGNAVTMQKIRYFGQHDYGNSVEKARQLVQGIKASSYPDREAIMTEVNAVCRDCDGGVYNKDYGFSAYAGPAYQYILQDLNEGITGVQVWEAYDSQYHHPNRYLTWSMWGIFAVNDTTRPDVYTVRTHFSVLRQLYNFVKPGYKRIDISTTLAGMTLSAFYDEASGTIVITGKNDKGTAQTLSCQSLHLPSVSSWKYYYSDDRHNFAQGKDLQASGDRYTQPIPANAVFTLVAKARP